METILTIAQIVVLFSLTGVAIYFVGVLIKAKAILSNIETDIKEVGIRLIPVLDNLEAITQKIRLITENINDQMTIVHDSVESIRTISENIVDFERRIQEQIEVPVLEIAGIIGSAVRTLTAIINRFRNR